MAVKPIPSFDNTGANSSVVVVMKACNCSYFVKVLPPCFMVVTPTCLNAVVLVKTFELALLAVLLVCLRTDVLTTAADVPAFCMAS